MRTKINVYKSIDWLLSIAFISGFLLLCLGGCKTVKETVQIQEETVTNQNNDLQVKSDSVKQVEVYTELEDKTETNDSLVVNEVTVVLSKPDSTGQQYPERITYRESTRVNNTKVNSNRIRDSTAVESACNTIIDKSETHTENKLEVKTDKKVSKPKILMWVLIVLAIGILVLAYFVLKRFKLIK